MDKEYNNLQRATELLEQYCLTIKCINGLETYIISPMQFNCLTADKELLENLDVFWAKDIIINLIQTIKKADNDVLYLAFVLHKGGAKKYQWEPVFCYKNEGIFYHVKYRESWMCRECGHILAAPIIMPMSEADAAFYRWTENEYAGVPSLFQRIPCSKCGKLLQNHLIVINSIIERDIDCLC